MRGGSLPRDGVADLAGVCAVMLLAEVRVCPVGEVCTKHEGVCLHVLSALNEICLSLEFKAFYERKSSLTLLNNLAEVDAVMLIFAACFSGVLSLFNTNNSWRFSLIGDSVPLAPVSPLIFFAYLLPKSLGFRPAFLPTGASLSILFRAHENKVLCLLLVT